MSYGQKKGIRTEDTRETVLHMVRGIFNDSGFPSRLTHKILGTEKEVPKRATAERRKAYISLSFKGDALVWIA